MPFPVWQAGHVYTAGTEVGDSNGNVQVVVTPGLSGVTPPLPQWQPQTNYSLGQQVVDSNGNIEQVSTPGISGPLVPSWNPRQGGATGDASVVWTNQGLAPPLSAWSTTVDGLTRDGSVTWATAITLVPAMAAFDTVHDRGRNRRRCHRSLGPDFSGPGRRHRTWTPTMSPFISHRRGHNLQRLSSRSRSCPHPSSNGSATSYRLRCGQLLPLMGKVPSSMTVCTCKKLSGPVHLVPMSAALHQFRCHRHGITAAASLRMGV